jgi:lactosylceramide 4-alpha-galactosyltransferase
MKTVNFNKKVILVRISVGLLITLFILSITKKEEKTCHEFSIPLNNFLDDQEMVKNSSKTQIFLLETHMEMERSLLDPGQACSVESAALTNPDADINLIFATNSDSINLKFNELIYQLKHYSNIHLTYVNPFELSKGTPAEKFFREERMKKSVFPIEHMADVLRILILNEFGGQYLDLDVFSLKPLSKIGRKNFACVESQDVICNGIMNFDTDENGGKAITNKYLE